MLGLDLRQGVGRQELGLLLTLLSDDASRLTAGQPALADTEPELAVVPARLTVTFGLGPGALALLGRRDTLPALPVFPGDRLERAWGQTDLVVQVCAEDPSRSAHARRVLLKDAATYATVTWVQEGFRRARGSEARGTTMRNVMGQVDGTVNPQISDADFDSRVWDAGPLGDDSTTMVVRRIRADKVGWDRVDRAGKELAVGRRLSDGASHVRRARSDDPCERFVHRVFNYVRSDPARPDAEDAGLVFIAFAADAQRQFIPVQRRLAGLDRLNQWVTTIGSAVYAVPPGAAAGRYVGQSLGR